MSGIQKTIAIGNVGRDPETRYTQDGKAVSNFSLAVTEKWKRDGQQHESVEWLACVAFGRLGEIVAEYVRKGSKLYIEGKIKTESYEKDGQKRYSTKIVLREMQMLDSRSDAPREASPPTSGQTVPPDDFAEDIPFAAEWRV